MFRLATRPLNKLNVLNIALALEEALHPAQGHHISLFGMPALLDDHATPW
jgi:hypothetical protein